MVLLPTDLLQSGLPAERTPSRADDTDADTDTAISVSGGGPVPESGPHPVRTQAAAFPAPFAVPALESSAEQEPHRRPAQVTALHRRIRTTQSDRKGRQETSEPAIPAAATPTAGAGDDSDLPRRVRQASLVPQLREEAPPEPRGSAGNEPEPAAGRTPEPVAGRTPEQARDRMTAYRDGWLRGGGPGPGSPAATTRPSTEGDQA